MVDSIAEGLRYETPGARKGGTRFKNLTVNDQIEVKPLTGKTVAGFIKDVDTKVSQLIYCVKTPATVERMVYIDVTHTSGKEVMYVISTMTATTGDSTAIRARGESAGATKSSGETRGVHAQGIANASKAGATVNALYAEAIAKGTSTVTTLRGAMIACDSEATPTSIGTMIGAHIRCKSSVDPSTAFENLRLTGEKFGSGHALDAHIVIDSVTWSAAETAADAGIEFKSTAKITSLIETSTPCTNVIKFTATTGQGFETGSLKDSADADIKCDAYMKIIQGANQYYAALYNTTN
jgi:hypothetical protein